MNDLFRRLMIHGFPFPKRLLLACLTACGALASVQAADPAGPLTLEKDIRPLLQKYCVDCHNPDKAKGDLDLLPLLSNPKLDEHREIWEKVIESLEAGDMPPEKKPQPTEEQRELLVHYIDGQLSKVDCTTEKSRAVTIRRLNKEEYRNTIRDLMGVHYEPRISRTTRSATASTTSATCSRSRRCSWRSFSPPRRRSRGRRSCSTPAGEAGDEAAARRAVRVRRPSGSSRWRSKALGLYREGEAIAKCEFPDQGRIHVRVRASGELAGPEAAEARRCGSAAKTLADFRDRRTAARARRYEVTATLPAGAQSRDRRLTSTTTTTRTTPTRSCAATAISSSSPSRSRPPPGPPAALPESHERLITRMPEPGRSAKSRWRFSRPFLPRAYRRPVDGGGGRAGREVRRSRAEKRRLLSRRRCRSRCRPCSARRISFSAGNSIRRRSSRATSAS